MSDFDEIKKEVMLKHGFVIDEKDSVLVTVTLAEIVLRRCIETLNEQNEAHQRAFSMALDVGVQESKKLSGRLVMEAAEFVSEQAHLAVTTAMDEGREQLRNDLRLARVEFESARKASAKWAAVSSICAAISVGALLAMHLS